MRRRLFLLPLLASGSLALGCSGASADAEPELGDAGPQAITAVLRRSADARPIKLNHHALKLLWGVTRPQEDRCGGAGIAGGELGGEAQYSHLGRTTVSVSAAWDIAHQLPPGTAHFKPVGPAGGPVAPVLGRGQYPYAFRYNPLTGNCGRKVVATGKVVLTAANGHQVIGDIVGGETHRLDFGGIPGSGVEVFARVEVTGGTGRFENATGSFVVHTIARPGLSSTGFVISLAEVLPGGTIAY